MTPTQAMVTIVILALIAAITTAYKLWLEHKQACYRVDNDYRQATSYWEKIYGFMKKQEETNERLTKALISEERQGVTIKNVIDPTVILEFLENPKPPQNPSP